MEPSTMEPSTPQHSSRSSSKHLTRDERIRVQTLRRIGWKHKAIALHLGITTRQVEHSLSSKRVTPKKRTGRRSQLTEEQVDQLEVFVYSSKTGRLMSYLNLSVGPFSNWEVGEYAIRNALRKRGYSRHVARAKPPLSPENRQIRLAFAHEHVNWTKEQ